MAAPIEAQARQGREKSCSALLGKSCARRAGWYLRATMNSLFGPTWQLMWRIGSTNNIGPCSCACRYRASPNVGSTRLSKAARPGFRASERFDRRFVTADGIEMAIRHFEEARQEVAEELGSFMSRLRRLAGYAFGMEGEDSRRSRVIWKFIAGILHEAVRRDIIRQNRRDWGDRDEWTIRFGRQTSTLHTICVVLCRRIARKARISARAPLHPDDDMVKPAHAVVVPDRDGEIWVRVANMHHATGRRHSSVENTWLHSTRTCR